MHISIFLAPQKEFLFVPRDERYWMLRLYVFLVFLCIESANFLTILCRIFIKRTVVLVTVQLIEIYLLAIRRPCNISEISICWISYIKIDCLLSVDIINSDGNLVACHTSHRVFVRIMLCLSLEKVNLRIVGYHTLIHTVKSKFLAILRPESSLFYSEFIPMNALAIYNLSASIG